MAKNIIVDNGAQQHRELGEDTSISSWVMVHVRRWEDFRKTNYDTKWDEYYRLWRGIWEPKDKSRDSERSRIVNPALSQAIEMQVAELEEASFGQGKYFDVSDNFNDADKTDIAMWRDQLEEDMEKEDVPAGISEAFLNGTIYGTAIGKIILHERVESTILPRTIGDTEITTPTVEREDVIRVGFQPIHPKEFVIDPSARTIDEALGMAHITIVPKHTIQEKQASGIYKDIELGGFIDTIVSAENDDDLTDSLDQDKTLIVEYHGLVPRDLLDPVEDDGVEDLFPEEADKKTPGFDMVEAIVTIANGSTLLRAVRNPYLMGDRCFVAYQHDTVPNRFWGRGIAEKGYNPQKALDAESRGRIDAMALAIHPMMAMDATRMQRGGNFTVAPGRSILTNGNPKEILMPFQFGQVNPTTFNQTGDLERQVQMGTGSMDSASPMGQNRRNETSGGMSMIMGGAIKRSKRTLANIERSFMKPLINKMAWRYMQFAPDRYPATDITFNVHSTLGMVAREIEQQQLTQMMQTVPPESPAFWMMLKQVFEFSSISNREEMLEIVEQMMNKSIQDQSQPPQPDPLIALKQEEMQLDAQMEQAKLGLKKNEGDSAMQLEMAKLQLKREELALKREDMMLDAKIALAQMEQDSEVTAAQMASKLQETPKEKPEAAPKAPDKPAIINIHNGSGKKTVTVNRTDNGLEGTIEEDS